MENSFKEMLNSISKDAKTLAITGRDINNIEGIEGYTNLEYLNLSTNSISDISPIRNLINLRILIIYSNKIKDISPIRKLENLYIVDLSYNFIENIEILSNLSNLVALRINSCFITDLSFLSKISNLKILHANYNNIQTLETLSELKHLESLDISRNQIFDIEPLMDLMKRGINVKWSQLTDHNFHGFVNRKTQGMELSKVQKGIFLEGNPLISPPPEMIMEGNASVINFFNEIVKQGLDYLFEAKLLIVGEGGAGKTTLARKLINPSSPMPKEEETTKGIDVHKLVFKTDNEKNFIINIWDFGGQEIYHATHQFFLTKRSLYVLVDDTRKDDKSINDATFNYWLQTVELFGEHSPLIIIQNEKGDRSKDIDLIGMRTRFPFVTEKYPTNLLTQRGLDITKNEIKNIIQTLPHVGTAIPKQWLIIRKNLAKLTTPTISQEKFFQICALHEISEKERALALSTHFHNLGIFLHFQKDPILKHIVILNNEWATEAVYKILDSELIKSKKGLFNKADVKSIWTEEYYREKHDELFELMNKFELCYELEDVNIEQFLIPQLLPVSQPKDYKWKSESDLQLRYKYDFMPKGLLSRFIVRMHHYILNLDKVWRKGVVLKRHDATAEIIELYGKNEIAIRVKGKDRKEFITIIDEEFNKIHRPLNNLQLKKLIPCNCNNCSIIDEPFFFNYDKLKEMIRLGKTNVECQTPNYLNVNIKKLIYDVFVYEEEFQQITLDRLNELSEKIDKTNEVSIDTNSLLSLILTDSSKIKFPYLFTLAPPSYELANSQSLTKTKYQLQFYCMHESEIHPHGEVYDIEVSKEWVANMAPYYNPMLEKIKSLVYLILPGAFHALGDDSYKTNKPNLEGFRDSIKALQPIDVGTTLRKYNPAEATEYCMELLEQILLKYDDKKLWKKHFSKVVKNGNLLWVCDKHKD